MIDTQRLLAEARKAERLLRHIGRGWRFRIRRRRENSRGCWKK
jgi:hypothetical protein